MPGTVGNESEQVAGMRQRGTNATMSRQPRDVVEVTIGLEAYRLTAEQKMRHYKFDE